MCAHVTLFILKKKRAFFLICKRNNMTKELRTELGGREKRAYYDGNYKMAMIRYYEKRKWIETRRI